MSKAGGSGGYCPGRNGGGNEAFPAQNGGGGGCAKSHGKITLGNGGGGTPTRAIEAIEPLEIQEIIE